MLKIFACIDAGIPVPETLKRGYNFTSEGRARVKRNYFKLPQNFDTTSFKKSHGDGDKEIAADRLYEREHNYKLSGWTAPLGRSYNVYDHCFQQWRLVVPNIGHSIGH